MKRKETYFTADTLAQNAAKMLRQTPDAKRDRLCRFTPTRSALLVLDLQRYFLEKSSHAFVPSAVAILPGIRALIQAFSACRLPIIFTRHLNTPADSGNMAAWWREVLTIENPLSAICPDLDVAAGTIIHKSQYDAFHGTALTEQLHDRSVTQVVVCGVMTHLCCESTVRSAFMHGFEVFFTVDGTATYNEAFHRATLLNLAHGFATLALVADLLPFLYQAGEHAQP
jgi:nicotinamidase-related amidase